MLIRVKPFGAALAGILGAVLVFSNATIPCGAAEIYVGSGVILSNFNQHSSKSPALIGALLRLSGELYFIGFDFDVVPMLKVNLFGIEGYATLLMPSVKFLLKSGVSGLSLGVTNPILVLGPILSGLGAYVILPVTSFKLGLEVSFKPFGFFADIGLNFFRVIGPISAQPYLHVLLGIKINF